ncbi:MAG TPA: hypothetical protein VJ583_03050 [Nitrososphaeraceae archaeon]|nr:hypothetical protein [Nitrososphaeraceae archaeon]
MNEKNENTKNNLTPFEKLAAAGEKAAVYMRTTDDFAHWVTDNITSVNVEECISILEDYIQSNEHIIQRINKVKS